MNNDWIEKAIQERDEAFRSLDEEKIRAYMKKYGLRDWTDSETAFWGGIHMARLEITTFTNEEKVQSVKWLMNHGFKRDACGRKLEDVLKTLMMGAQTGMAEGSESDG